MIIIGRGNIEVVFCILTHLPTPGTTRKGLRKSLKAWRWSQAHLETWRDIKKEGACWGGEDKGVGQDLVGRRGQRYGAGHGGEGRTEGWDRTW